METLKTLKKQAWTGHFEHEGTTLSPNELSKLTGSWPLLWLNRIKSVEVEFNENDRDSMK